MKFRNVALATAAATLSAAPVAAQTVNRETAPVADENELRGGSSIILAILAVAAVIAGIILLVDDSNDEAVSA